MMPGGGSSEGDGSLESASCRVSTHLAVKVGSLQPFQAKGDPHSVSRQWRKWKRAFQLYVLGKGTTHDVQKRGLLVHTAGLDVQEVYFTLVPDGAEKNYVDRCKVLDDYFIPKANVPFERHLFRQISHSSEETIDQFLCRLRQRATSSEFGEWEDEYIRDQLIDKCYFAKLRRKFLEKEGSVTLDDLLATAQVQEAVNLQMEAMGANNISGQVNTVVEDEARGDGISSEQVNSVADIRGVLVARRGTVSISLERTILPGIGDVLLEVESVISVEKLDISRSSVIRSSLRIPIRGKDKVTVGVIGEIQAERETQIMLTVILNQCKTPHLTMCFQWGICWVKGVE